MKTTKIATDFELICQDYGGSIHEIPFGTLGTKIDPLRLSSKYNMQHDGPLAEIAIDPVDNFSDFNNNIQAGLDGINSYLEYFKYTNLSSYIYKSLSKQARELGCSPSLNIYTGEENKPKELSGKLKNFRTAGGHIHIDVYHSSYEDVQYMGQKMDLFLGTYGVLNDPDEERKKLYGQAGDIRVKQYGIEYRTLSNFWVFNKKTRRDIWELSHKALAYQGTIPDTLEQAINNGDKVLCQDILSEAVA